MIYGAGDATGRGDSFMGEPSVIRCVVQCSKTSILQGVCEVH